MSKEWLEDWLKDKKEQLRSATVFINENGNEAVEVSLSVLNKLFEQAERVNELEQQNKRYREALNSIITLWIASTDATDDTWLAHEMSETARKALEGDDD